MKQWGVFTSFYNGITIDNSDIAIDFFDTEDAASAEALREAWKCYKSIQKNEIVYFYGKSYEKISYEYKLEYSPTNRDVVIYERRGYEAVPVRKWSWKEAYELDFTDQIITL